MATGRNGVGAVGLAFIAGGSFRSSLNPLDVSKMTGGACPAGRPIFEFSSS